MIRTRRALSLLAVAAGLTGCGPERYSLRYRPETADGAAPFSPPRRDAVFVGDFQDASGGVTMTRSVLRPKTGLERKPVALQAIFDPPLAAVLKDAAVAELKRLGIRTTERKSEADEVLSASISDIALDYYDDSLVGGPVLVAQRAAIVLTVVLSDRSGRTLRSEILKGSGEMRRFGPTSTTREMILNRAVAEATIKLQRLFEEPTAPIEPARAAAAAPAAAEVPWWEAPISK